MRKVTPKRAKMRAWQALSKFVRQRDKYCQTCPTGKAEHCGHFYRNSERSQSLGGNELWYDERNFLGQCFSCNNMRSGEGAKAAVVLEKKYGHGILQELLRLYHKPKKWTVEELLAVEKKYLKLAEDL